VKCVENFVNECQFIQTWDNLHMDFTHYQDTGDITHTSTVDHILWNDASHEKIIDAGAIHIPINTSDQCPIYCVVDIGLIQTEDGPGPKLSLPKPCWQLLTRKHSLKIILKTHLIR
jgi:hypothetical protein